MQRILAGSGIYGLGSVLTQAVAFFLIPLYTRYLTPADYGILATVKAIGSVLLLLYSLDLGTAVSRFYFEYQDDVARLRRYVGTISLFLLTSSLALTLLGMAVGPTLIRLWMPGEWVPFHPYLTLTLWSTCFSVLSMIPLILLQMRERAVNYVILTVGRFLITTLAILYFVVIRREGALGSIKGSFVADTICFCVFGVMAIRESALAFDRRALAQSLALSLPMVPHLLAHWVLALSDRLLLQRMSSSSEAGLYSLGYNFGMAMLFAVTAFNASWVPVYYDVAMRDQTPLATLGRLSTTWIMALCAVAAAGILFAREGVVLMASPAYLGAAKVVPLVILAYLFNGLYLFPANSLFLRKDTRWLPLFTIAAAAINVFLNLWWIPRAGAMGAAWATLVSYAVLFWLVFSYAHRRFPVAYEYRRLGIALGAVGLLGVAAMHWPSMPLAASIGWKSLLLALLTVGVWRAGAIPQVAVAQMGRPE